MSAKTRRFLRINPENLEFKESRDDPWILLLDLTLPFPLLSVLHEVLLPVQCSRSFHSEAGALCRNSDCLILEMVCSAYLLLAPCIRNRGPAQQSFKSRQRNHDA